MQRDGQVSYAKRFYDGEDDVSLHMVASGVLSMRFFESDVKIGDITRSRSEGGSEAGEEGGLGRRMVVERQVGDLVKVGTHLFEMISNAANKARACLT